MAIVTIKSSKATPAKALAYITDRGKAALVNTRHMDPSKDLAWQMKTTCLLWGKALKENDRKYYHLKISFDPKDWTRNGGPLTEQECQQIGMQIMREVFPGSESAGSTHTDRGHLHFHGLANAVDMETGKMVDLRNADYRHVKDRVQEICVERGLTAIDWRKATKEKRERERQADEPISKTFAEKGLQARGKAVWKDELRSIIDAAATSCYTMEEFRTALESQGVTLTRCTDTTISYKLGEHKACRGDTLGGDYTAQAIQLAVKNNSLNRIREQVLQEKPSLSSVIGSADHRRDLQVAGCRVVSAAEREQYREWGRDLGLKRADIDEMCDQASKATWEEKQAVWGEYKAARTSFWEEYAIRQQSLQKELKQAYKRRRRVSNAEWAINPRNRRRSLLGTFYAIIVLSREDSRSWIDADIEKLKKAQHDLKADMQYFKRYANDAVETLREKDLSLDAYLKAVKTMEGYADYIAQQNRFLDQKERDKLQRDAEKAKKKYQKNNLSR